MTSIKSILLFNFLGMLSMIAFLPVAGPITRTLNLQEWHAGLIVGISGVFWMVSARFWGKLSDTKGRRPVLFLTITGFMLSYLVLAVFLDNALDAAWSIAFTLSLFVLLRGLMGAFYAGVPATCAAYIADVTSKENRTAGMALLGASTGLGMVFGPFISGLLAKQHLILPLYVAAIMPVFSVLLVLFAIPKVKHLSPSNSIPPKLTDPRLRLPILAALLASSSIYMAQVCIGFFGIDVLHLDAQHAAEVSGYAMGAVGISMIVVQIAISKLKSIPPIIWLKIGALVGGVGFAFVGLVGTTWGLLCGYAIAALGLGAVFPAMQTIASHSVSEQEQGIAAGSVAAAQGLAMVIAPIVGTLIYEINPLLPYFSTVILLGALWIYTFKHHSTF